MIRCSFPGEVYHTSAYKATSDTKAALLKKAGEAAPIVSAPTTDRVQISAEGSFKRQLAEATKSVEQEIMNVSSDRISSLKNQIASDQYDVSSSAVADAMLNRFFTQN